MTVGPFQPGDYCGKYQIVGLLGAGGYGCVYEAKREQPTMIQGVFQPQEERVALKCLQKRHAADPNARERLQQEAVLLMRVKHGNIVRFIECGDPNETGIEFFVMELLEGRTLEDELASGRLPVRRALEVGYKIADGLSLAHDKGVLHLDLNPRNIFVTERREIKVLDLGAAKYEYSWDRANPQWPITVTYAAPEQLRLGPAHRGVVPVDHRADIFAVGEMVYEMLTGEHPFRGTAMTPEECAVRQYECVARPLRELGVGEEVAAIIDRAIAKQPADRQASMVELRDALRRAMFRQTEDTGEFDLEHAVKLPATYGRGLGTFLGNRIPTAPNARPLAIFESPTRPNVRALKAQMIEGWMAEPVIVNRPVADKTREFERAPIARAVAGSNGGATRKRKAVWMIGIAAAIALAGPLSWRGWRGSASGRSAAEAAASGPGALPLGQKVDVSQRADRGVAVGGSESGGAASCEAAVMAVPHDAMTDEVLKKDEREPSVTKKDDASRKQRLTYRLAGRPKSTQQKEGLGRLIADPFQSVPGLDAEPNRVQQIDVGEPDVSVVPRVSGGSPAPRMGEGSPAGAQLTSAKRASAKRNNNGPPLTGILFSPWDSITEERALQHEAVEAGQ